MKQKVWLKTIIQGYFNFGASKIKSKHKQEKLHGVKLYRFTICTQNFLLYIKLPKFNIHHSTSLFPGYHWQ